MIKVTMYDPTKTYMYPNGQLATPEDVRKRYPAVTVFPHVIETDRQEQVLYALENLAGTREAKGIDPALSDAEAIRAIEDSINAPQISEPGPEERIAAALEFQNLML